MIRLGQNGYRSSSTNLVDEHRMISTELTGESRLSCPDLLPVVDALLDVLTEGVEKLATKIGGTARLKEALGGGAFWSRQKTGICKLFDQNAGACTVGHRIDFYDDLFTVNVNNHLYLKATAAHELAHVVNDAVCLRNHDLCAELLRVSDENRHKNPITIYGGDNVFEYWAEAVTDWVFGHTAPDGYQATEAGRKPIGRPMEDLIGKVFELPPLP